MYSFPRSQGTRTVVLLSISFLACVAFIGRWSWAQNPKADAKLSDREPMTNERLGKLLKKHFPKEPFRQTGPGMWIIEVDGDPDKPQQDDAEDSSVENEDDQTDQLQGEQPDAAEAMDGVMLVMTDENANRMRIMMPIQSFDPRNEDDLKTALIALHANYDRALDARYAVSDGVLWSAFIHPLRSLTEEDLSGAIQQVRTLRKTTGTTYTSGALIFGPKAAEDPDGDAEDSAIDPTV